MIKTKLRTFNKTFNGSPFNIYYNSPQYDSAFCPFVPLKLHPLSLLLLHIFPFHFHHKVFCKHRYQAFFLLTIFFFFFPLLSSFSLLVA